MKELVSTLEDWANACSETIGAVLNQSIVKMSGRHQEIDSAALNSRFGEGTFCLPVEVTGELKGSLRLALEGSQALDLASSMAGEEEVAEELNSVHREVLGEGLFRLAELLGETFQRLSHDQIGLNPKDIEFDSLGSLDTSGQSLMEFPLAYEDGSEFLLCVIIATELAEQLAEVLVSGPLNVEGAAPNLARPKFGQVQNGSAPREMPQRAPSGLDIILDVPLEVMAVLGKTSLMIEELLSISEGSVLELDKLAGEPIELYVKDRLVALGEVVVIDERFGVKILEMVSGRQSSGRVAAH